LNDRPAVSGPVYKSTTLRDADALYCQVTPKQDACLVQPVSSNTIRVEVYAVPVLRIAPADTVIAMGGTVQFKTAITGTVAQYTWSPLSQLQAPLSLNPTTTVLTDGVEYFLTVTNDKGCKATGKAIVNVIKKLYMANAFTPNNDGINDIFRIPPGVTLTLKSFTVYDRWGNAVFTTRNSTTGWDGTLKGQPLNTGNYVYVIEGTDEKGKVFLKGNVLLLR
jgi:gliding motility-associated-like protein